MAAALAPVAEAALVDVDVVQSSGLERRVWQRRRWLREQRRQQWMWMWCSRAVESGGNGGGGCVDTDGIGGCGEVELTSLVTTATAAVNASTQTASEHVMQSS